MIEATRHGLPVSAVDALIESGRLTLGEIDRVVLPRKTLAHRRALGALTSDQSDRLMRVARVIAAAEDTFVRLLREGASLAAPADDGARRRRAARLARHIRGEPPGRTPARKNRPRTRRLTHDPAWASQCWPGGSAGAPSPIFPGKARAASAGAGIRPTAPSSMRPMRRRSQCSNQGSCPPRSRLESSAGGFCAGRDRF